MAVVNLGQFSVGAVPVKIGVTTQNVLNFTVLGSNNPMPGNWSFLIYESWGIGSFGPKIRAFPYLGLDGQTGGTAGNIELAAPAGVNREIRVFTDRQVSIQTLFLSILWSDLAVP